jgi:hypothetical protein
VAPEPDPHEPRYRHHHHFFVLFFFLLLFVFDQLLPPGPSFHSIRPPITFHPDIIGGLLVNVLLTVV